MKKLFTFLFLLCLCVKANSQSYVIGYEYWCDSDYSSRYSVSVPPQTQFTLDTSLGFPGINKGLHLLNIRFQQNNFYWSQTISEYFYKTGEGVSASGDIIAYRYWIEGIDSVITFHLSTPVNPYNLVVNLDLSWAQGGSNYLYMQFGDEQDNWSVASVDSFYKPIVPNDPVALFYSEDSVICLSDSVHFFNLSLDANVYQWYFGDGDSSIDVNPVHYYQQPGHYSVTLIATDTVSGLDSTVTFNNYIGVHQPSQASFSFTMVNSNVTFINNSLNAISYAWDFGDSMISYLVSPVHTYQFAGNYTVILTAFDSCGSTVDTQYVSITLSMENISALSDIEIVQSNHLVTMNFNSPFERLSYSLKDIAGHIIIRDEIPHVRSGDSKNFSIESLAQGVYILSIYDGKTAIGRKILKIS